MTPEKEIELTQEEIEQHKKDAMSKLFEKKESLTEDDLKYFNEEELKSIGALILKVKEKEDYDRRKKELEKIQYEKTMKSVKKFNETREKNRKERKRKQKIRNRTKG